MSTILGLLMQQGSWDDISGETFLRGLLSRGIEVAQYSVVSPIFGHLYQMFCTYNIACCGSPSQAVMTYCSLRRISAPFLRCCNATSSHVAVVKAV